MATKLYFHAALADGPGTYPSAEQSSLTATTNGDAQTVNRSMNTSIGTAQTSITNTTTASVSALSSYFTRFVSLPINQSGIAANTWNYSYAANEPNINANFPCNGANQVVAINVYVWRPSTNSIVGTILDGNTAATNSEGAASTITSQYATFAGAAVAGAQAGDVIVCEIWFTLTQGNATARADIFYYDGTTETLATGTTVSNHASHINTPETISFQSAPTLTKLYFHNDINIAAGTLPTAEQSALTSAKNVDAQTINRYMNTSIGVAQTSITLSSINNTSANDYYFTRFVSDALTGVSSLPADTWKYAFACSESNASANFPVGAANSPCYLNVYVWRPSSGTKIGTILDGNTNSLYAEPGAVSSERSEYGTFAGSLVSGISNGDVIVCEIWFRITQAAATAYNDIFYYDGTTENNTVNTVVSNYASYIATWTALSFTQVSLQKVRTVSDTVPSLSESTTNYIIPSPGVNANILTKKTTLTLDSTSGVHDQSFTGIGFQPKAVIIWGVPVTANDVYNNGLSISYGFSDGTNNFCTAIASVDNVSTLDDSSMIRNDACISILSVAAGNAELVRGKIKTFDTDGATFTWNVKDTNQYIIHALFIGGSDITNVIAKSETIGTTATGNKGYTGYGFKPDIVLFAYGRNATINTLTAVSQFGIGAATGAGGTKQFSFGEYQADNTAPNTGGVDRWEFDNNAAIVIPKAAGNSEIQAALVTLDTDGYTLNHLFAPSSSTYPFFCLAIKGGYWDVGTFQQRTSTGTTTITQLIKADPEALMLIGSDVTTANSQNSSQGAIDPGLSIGAADNTAEGYAFFSYLAVTSPTADVMISSTGKVIRNATPAATATSSALTAEADTSDMATAGQFSINYTTASATARWIGYIVLGKGQASTGTTYQRTASDTTSLSESLARVKTAIRSPTDTTSLSESRNRVLTLKRSPATDSISLSESNLRKFIRVRSASDTTSLSESLIRKLSLKRLPATDIITLNETLSRVKTAKRIPATDSTTLSESLIRKKTAKRTVTDTTSLSESMIRRTQLKRTPSDTTTLNESLVRHLTQIRTKLDTISFSESLIRKKTAKRTITDTTSLSESLSRKLTAIRNLSHTLTLSESLARHIILKRTQSDSISLSETLNKISRLRRTLSDTSNLSESLIRRAMLKRLLSDTSTFSESIFSTTQATILRTATDSIALSESLARHLTLKRIKSDTTSLSESLVSHQIKRRLLADTISLSDSIVRSVFTTILRTLSDSISLSESTSRHVTLRRNISDTLSLSESLNRYLFLRRTLLNTIAFSEILIRTKLLSRSRSDSISLSETRNRTLISRRIKSDTVLFSESLVRRLTLPRSLTDVINLNESISSTILGSAILRTATDSISFSESIFRIKTAIRHVTDIMGGQGFTKYVCSLSDTIVFNESIQAIIIRAHPDVFIPPERISTSQTIWKSVEQVKQKHKPIQAEIQKPLRVSQHITRYCVDAIAFIDFVQGRVIKSVQQADKPILPQIKYVGASMTTQDDYPRTAALQPIEAMKAVKTNVRSLYDYIYFDENIQTKVWRKQKGEGKQMIIDTAASTPSSIQPLDLPKYVRVKTKIRIITRVPKYAENHIISKNASIEENALNAKLIVVVSHLQKLKLKGDMAAYYDNEYRVAADRAIRASIESIYRNAADYGSRFAKSEYYTTNKDIENIERLSENFQRVFWRRVNHFVFDRDIETSQTQPQFNDTTGSGVKRASKPNLLSPEFIVQATTAMLATQTLKVAIVSKVSEVKLRSSVITTSSIVGHPVDPSETQIKTAFKWITAHDDKVCPVCSQLDGQVWPLEESFDIPDPDSDTHPNCRCIVVPVEYYELP